MGMNRKGETMDKKRWKAQFCVFANGKKRHFVFLHTACNFAVSQENAKVFYPTGKQVNSIHIENMVIDNFEKGQI